MTTTSDTAAPPAAVQPVIDSVKAQIIASVPSQYTTYVAAQFASPTGAVPAAAAAPAATTIQLPVFSYPAAASSSAGLDQPTISFIQQEITALLPAQYASAVTAQFAGAATPSNMPAAPVPTPAGAASQIQAISDELKAFFSAPPTSSP